MKTTFLIVGASGSGKTTICNELEKYGLNTIPSCTTRQPRYAGEQGHTFITMEQYRKDLENDNIVAYTYFDGHHYYCTKEMLHNPQWQLYVIDPDGIKYLKEKVNDIHFITIYIKSREFTRIQRMRSRGESDQSIKKRLRNDEDKFKKVDYDYAVTNIDLKKSVAIVKNIVDVEMTENYMENLLSQFK